MNAPKLTHYHPYQGTVNSKPVMVDALKRAAMFGAPTTIVDIKRISAGHVGTPEQIEDVEITFRDGTIEKISIKEMSTDEAFVTLCQMIGAHEPYRIIEETI